jgi:hypothetical protein
MADFRVFWNGTHIGLIRDLKGDTPNSYGKWIPQTPEWDEKLREAIEREEQTGEREVLLMIEGTREGSIWIVSALEGDDIDVRPRTNRRTPRPGS